MPLANPDVVRCIIYGTALDQDIMFVGHLRVETNDDMGDTLTELETLAAALHGDSAEAYPWTANYRACLPTGYKTNQVSCQVIAPLARQSARVDYYYNAEGGTGGAGPSAPNIACCMPLAAGLRGRKYLSKFHIGPLPDSKYADGYITNAQQTAVNALGALMIVNPFFLTLGGGGEQASFSWGVFHRNAQPTTNNFNAFQLLREEDTVRVQRRRTIGVGK